MHNGHLLLSDVDTKESSKIPCILHMDSIKGSHSGLKNIIQRFVSNFQYMELKIVSWYFPVSCIMHVKAVNLYIMS